MALTSPLRALWLGRRRYAPVYDLQRQLLELRKGAACPDTLLLVEHESVITLGRGAQAQHVSASPETLENLGVERFVIDRGGDVTLHAPGQLVAYPIVDLGSHRKDVRRYVQDLAETMRRLLAEFGIDSGLAPCIGVWVDSAQPQHYPGADAAVNLAKIGAIGVRISRWVTMHGFALNLSTDMSLFELIVPCGIRHHGVTSVQQLLGSAPSVAQAARRTPETFAAVLDTEVGAWLDVSAHPWQRILRDLAVSGAA